MKNRLVLLAKKIWQKKQLFFQTKNSPLRNLKQIENDHQRRTINFLAFVIVGLIASTLVGLYLTSNASLNIPYKTSWIGNTFSGGSKWVQIHISAMYIANDGTVYTNSVWDEAGREAGIYKDGDVIGQATTLHGWGRTGGEAVTANDKYLYIAMTQGSLDRMVVQDYPPSKTNWYCVRRYHLSGEPAPFPGGRGYDGSMLIVSTSSLVTGLVNASNKLYVSDSATNRIRVYDAETMAELRSWSVDRPQQMAVDAQGNLWIIRAKDASNPPKILNYSKIGTLLSKQITDVVNPTALAIDNQGRLLVAENGPRQQVLIYNISGIPKLIGTFGDEGGIYSGTPGEIGELKLNGITGVGTDAEGNIYVSNNGFGSSGTDLRQFSRLGELQWRLLGLQFVDNADADPATDGVEVFTKQEHFIMDYSQGSGQEWSYKAYTLNKFRYPDDPRDNEDHTVASVFVRRIEGKRFLYMTGMYAKQLSVYRFDGEIAVPSVIFAREHSTWPINQPATGSWLWRDKNGDGSIQSDEYESLGAADGSIWGWEVDSKGDIWQTSESGLIRHYRYQGLDAYGSPNYIGSASEVIPMPAPFNKLERIKYFPDTDVMYLAGYTVDRPHAGEEWGIVGTEIVRFDNWTIDIPYALRAYRRSNGEYVVFVEEDAKAKVIMYRFASND